MSLRKKQRATQKAARKCARLKTSSALTSKASGPSLADGVGTPVTMEDVKLMLYRVKENAEGALGFIAQIEGISHSPTSASPATARESCGSPFEGWTPAKVRQFNAFAMTPEQRENAKRHIEDHRRLDAALAKKAAHEPRAGDGRRKRTPTKFCEHATHRVGHVRYVHRGKNKRLWCLYCGRPYRPPSPRPRG